MSTQWLVKSSNGKIQGPFSEEEICKGIENFEFNGEEYISEYPLVGHWKIISSYPKFYDALFKIISATKAENQRGTASVEEVKLRTKSKDSSFSNDRLRSTQDTFSKESIGDTEDSVETSSSGTTDFKSKFKTVRISKRKGRSSSVIDMEDSQSFIFQKIFKRLVLPALIITALVFGFIFFFLPSQNRSLLSEKIQLVSPRKGQPKSSTEEILVRIKRGIGYYMSDQISNYLKAQSEFSQAVEGDYKNKFALAYLCLTYLELWPYAYQNSKDMGAVSFAVQQTAHVDPGGVYSALCRSVQHLMQDKQEQAKSLIKTSIGELAMNSNPENISPFFYYLKGRVHAHQLEYDLALQSLEYALSINSEMLSVYTLSAQIFQKKKQLNQALKFYSDILGKNSQHKTAMLGKGILMYKYLGRRSQGESIIREALSLPDLAPPSYLAGAYFILAKIALKLNDSVEFLKYGKKAYALDPANKELKKLIQQSGVSLENQERLTNTQIKSRLLIEKGDQLAREGSSFEARGYYKQAFTADQGKNAIAAVKMAESLWKSGFSSEAVEWLQRATIADPQFIRPYILMSEYYSQLYEMDKAARALKTAHKRSPNNLEVFKGYALLLLKREDFEGALTYAQKALGVYESDVQAHVILSQAYFFLGDFNQSLQAASRAKEIDSNNKTAQIQYGRVLGQVYGMDNAFDYFEDLISKTQDGSQIHFDYVLSLAQLLHENNKPNNALNVLKTIEKIEEKPVQYHILLGKIYSQKAMEEEDIELRSLAQEEFLQAALINPSDPQVMYELSQLLMISGDYNKAQSYLEKILSSYPHYPKIHYFIALILQRKGGKSNLEQALERIKRENAINPNLPEAYKLAGDIYESLGRYTLCAQAFQKVIELFSEDSESYVRSAVCYRMSGELDLALRILKGVSENSKNQKISNPKIYRELGAIYEMKKNYDRAQASYNIYFDILPNAKDKQQIQARIAKFGE